MARPALFASRSIDIIELLSAFPDREFTLSEIMRATRINVSSCHAILAALTGRGYLTRSPTQKTYRLGPLVNAIGQAALRSQPIVGHIRRAAEELVAGLGLPVLLSTALDDEILALLVIETANGRDAGMHVGERLPLIAPVGAPFFAWAAPADVGQWLARRGSPLSADHVAEVHRDLELTRERGFHLSLRSMRSFSLASLMADMATGPQVADFKDEVRRLIDSFDHYMCQPEILEPDMLYDVLLIATPIFDRTGKVAYNLCLGGFTRQLSGTQVRNHADRLMPTCYEIMRADRA